MCPVVDTVAPNRVAIHAPLAGSDSGGHEVVIG